MSGKHFILSESNKIFFRSLIIDNYRDHGAPYLYICPGNKTYDACFGLENPPGLRGCIRFFRSPVCAYALGLYSDWEISPWPLPTVDVQDSLF